MVFNFDCIVFLVSKNPYIDTHHGWITLSVFYPIFDSIAMPKKGRMPKKMTKNLVNEALMVFNIHCIVFLVSKNPYVDTKHGCVTSDVKM